MEEFYFDYKNNIKSYAMATFIRNFFLIFYKNPSNMTKDDLLETTKDLQLSLKENFENEVGKFCSFTNSFGKKWEGFSYLEKKMGVTIPRNLIFKPSSYSNACHIFMIKNSKIILIGQFEYDCYGKLTNIFAINNNTPVLDETGIKSIINNYNKINFENAQSC